jgi:DNA-directed RNA polymerase subunit F
LNNQVHSEEKINEEINKIMKIKNITSREFKNKLNRILIKGNRISKYKSQLKALYEAKIINTNKEHMKMLYDIWFKYNPNDKDIQDIDRKWRKLYTFVN